MTFSIAHIISQAHIIECELHLPDVSLTREEYLKVDAFINMHGGKWDRKRRCHVFLQPPHDIKEHAKGNDGFAGKKVELQQFYTPACVVEELIKSIPGISEQCRILEPSAGRGHIAGALLHHSKNVTLVELDAVNFKHLQEQYANKVSDIINCDFLDYAKTTKDKFDLIVMNPPFSKNRDALHILAALNLVAKGGSLHAIIPTGWERKLAKPYRELLEKFQECRGGTIALPKNSFKDSGTNVDVEIISMYV